MLVGGARGRSLTQRQMFLEVEFALYSRLNLKPPNYKTGQIKKGESGGDEKGGQASKCPVCQPLCYLWTVSSGSPGGLVLTDFA